jgi:gliding motility-associated-like protein
MKNNNKMATFFKILILAIVLGAAGSQQLKAQDNSGTEFWFTLFAETYIDHLPGVYIVSYYDCTVTIDYVARDPALDPAGLPECTRNVVTVVGGVPKYVDIPFDAQAACWRFSDDLETPETVGYNGIKVTSTAPIALYSQFFTAASSEMTPIFPVEDMGTDYIVSAYREITSETTNFNARTTVVGIEDNTEVTFTLPDYCWTSSTDADGAMTHGPGSSWTVTLNEGETYTVLSNDNGQGLTFTPTGSSVTVTNNQGLNGMKVSATKIISVLGGTDCTWVGNDEYPGCGACDLTCTHLKPTSKWDTRFVTTQTLVRPNQMSLATGLASPPTPNIEPYPADFNELSVADYLIITAKDDATTINITGVANYTKNLDAGEWFIYESPGNSNPSTPPPTTSPGAANHLIEANNPIQVVQMMKGWQCDNNNPADPTQMSVIEEAIWKDNYIVTNPTQYANNFFAFIVKEPFGNNVARNSLNLSVNGADLPIATGISATNNGTGGWTQIGTEPYFFQRVTFSTAGAAIRAKSVALTPGGTTYPFAFYASGSTNASSYGYMGGNVCQLKVFAHADTGNVCLGTPVPLILDSTQFGGPVGGVTNYTYSWIIDNGVDTIFNFSSIGLDPDTSYTPTPADTLGIYTGYLVITDNADCQAIDTFVVYIEKNIPSPTVGPDVTVCEGDTIFLSANSSLDEVTYLWSGPADFSDTDQNPIIPNATATMDGTYNVTIANNGCTSLPVSVNVTVTPGASIILFSAVGTDAQAVCDSTPIINITYSIGGTGTGAGATGLPTGVTGIFNSGTLTISGTPTDTGTFNYTIITTGTCKQDTALGAIVVNSAAAIDSIPFTNESFCGAGDGAITIYATGTDLTYSIDGGETYGGSDTFNNLAAGTYTVFVNNTSNCPVNGGIISISSPGASPAPTAIANPATVCVGDSFLLYVSTTVGGETYNWSGPNSYTATGDSVTINTVTASMAGTYTVTAILEGCTSPGGSVTVTVNPNDSIALTSAVGTDNQDICLSIPLTNITYAIGGGDTSPNATGLPTGVTGFFNSGTFTISGTPADTGTFYYTVTTTGSCMQATATGTITVNSCIQPIASFTPSATTICLGDSITFTENSSGTNTNTWNWTFNSGTPTTATTQGPHTVQYNAPGTYNVILEITDDNGTDDTTMTITVNPLPTVDAGMDQAVCSGGAVTLSGSGATSYTWDNGVSDGVAFTPTATKTYNVTGADGNNCENTDMVIVTVNNCIDPIASFTPSATTICLGDSITFTDKSTGTNVNTWNWIFNGATPNNINTQGPHTVQYNAPGTYNVILQITDDNELDDTTMTITVQALPTVVAGLDQTLCSGDTVTLNGSGATNYVWDNGVNDGMSFTPTVTNTYTVTGTDSNGCSNTDQVVVNVIVPPTPQFTADTLILCLKPQQAFTFYNQTETSSGGNGTSFWDFGDNTGDIGDTVSHSYPSTGSYNISLTTSSLIDNSCSVTLTKENYVNVYNNPIADFTTTPEIITMLNPIVNFMDASSLNIIMWSWDINGLDTFNTQNSSYTFPEDTGTYYVNLSVTDNNGCKSSKNSIIVIDGDYSIYVPTAFTPDGNSFNEGFAPKGFGISEDNYSFFIFDRWGELMFETHTKFQPWDAYYKGNLVSTGNYVWKLKFKDLNNVFHQQIGTVTLVK